MTLYCIFMLAYVCIPCSVLHSDPFLLYFMLSVYTWGHFLTYVYTSQWRPRICRIGALQEPPPKFLIFRRWLGQITKNFEFWLNLGFPWLDWQSFEVPWAWSCLDCGLRECTVKLFEAARDDRHGCLDTQSRPRWYSELVVGVLLNQENNHLLPVYCWTDCRSRD